MKIDFYVNTQLNQKLDKCCLLLFNTGVSNPENVEHLEEQNMFNM